MLAHLDEIDDEPFDLCIVGAGSAGLTIARKLSGRGLRVLLLESGVEREDDAHDALTRHRSIGVVNNMIDKTMRRRFGGASEIWCGYSAPLDPIDFEARPWAPDSGWPIDAADLAPHYRAAHEHLSLDAFDYDLERRRGDHWVAPFDEEASIESGLWTVSAERFGSHRKDETLQGRRTKSCGDDFLHEIVVPSGGFAFSFEASFSGSV